ncbi:MAG: 6-phosphogluconolactonase [Candidatus Thorarchaeota archaeon]
MFNRKAEVRSLMKLFPQEVIQRAGDHLVVCDTLEKLHRKFAEDIFNEIKINNNKRKPTKIILPIGPTGQYPYLVDLIEKFDLDLSNCWLFFMDEYCDEDGYALSVNHPLSFKRIAKKLFLLPLKDKFGLKTSQVTFPEEKNISKLANIIENLGGIDTCYGGIGIHGHIAFNEPEPNIINTDPRKVALSDTTITINCIRANVGGNLESFPKEAYTIGMKQILRSNRIRLYCRNGSPYDWANTILRITLFGTPGDDYPVTWIRNHPNYVIITDKDTLTTPLNLL